MNDKSVAKFSVQIIDRTGEFVLNEGASVVCTGRVSCPETTENFLEFQESEDDSEGGDDGETNLENKKKKLKNNTHLLGKREIYKELRIRGYDYGPSFQGLTLAASPSTRSEDETESSTNISGSVQWTGHWISYVDSALHLSLLALPIRTLFVPVGIDFFRCDPLALFDAIKAATGVNSHQATLSNFEQKNLNREIQEKAITCDINKQHLQSEFCYFKDIAERSAIIERQSAAELDQAAKVDATTIPFQLINGDFSEEEEKRKKSLEAEKDKKVFFDVHFDLATQTLFSKGIEVRGLIPVNIPRHFEGSGLLLETYRFVPFDRTWAEDFKVISGPKKLNFLEEYISVCGQLLKKVLTKFELDAKVGQEMMDQLQAEVEDFVVEKFTSAKDQPEYSYAKTLKSLLDQEDQIETENNNSPSSSKLELLQRQLTESLLSLQEDLLNDGLFLSHETYSRPIFELVAENFQHQGRVKVLEITPGSRLLVDAVSNLLKLNVIHKFELDYTATRHEDLLLPVDSSKHPDLKTIDWNRSDLKFLESASGEYDLIILRPCSEKTTNLWTSQTDIDLLKGALKPGGFLLILSRDHLTPFEIVLDSTEILSSEKHVLAEKFTFQSGIGDKNNLHEYLTTTNNSTSVLALSETSLQAVSCHRQPVTGTQLALYRRNAFTLEVPAQGGDFPAHIHSVEIDTSEGVEVWMESLKAKVKIIADEIEAGTAQNARLWIVSRANRFSGILGFANCLRLEAPYGGKVRVLFVVDNEGKGFHDDLLNALKANKWKLEATFASTLPSCSAQQLFLLRQLVAKDLAVNVFYEGTWGSFRFTRLPEEAQQVTTGAAYLSQAQRGDLSSLTWYESELGNDNLETAVIEFTTGKTDQNFPNSLTKEESFQICDVYYSALNFKDVVIASGKIVPGPESALVDCVLGLEFSGRNRMSGERVMGMVPFRGIATAVLTHQDFLWTVPPSWTLEEAATVPVVYITAYYALVVRGHLQSSDSILIHSGAGGVGQAALNIAHSLGVREIFASVGTREKRTFLKENFGLDDRHILDSRSTTFERAIKKVTKGRGVDVVLNSLTGDKLQVKI